MKRYREEIRLLVGLVVFIILFIFVMRMEYKGDVSKWNNGICIECNGQMKFSGGSHHRTSEHYYYSCNDCGHTIETHSLMQ